MIDSFSYITAVAGVRRIRVLHTGHSLVTETYGTIGITLAIWRELNKQFIALGFAI